MDIEYDLNDYIRVLKLVNTSSWQELPQISKIVDAGTLLVRLFGFITLVAMSFLPGGV